MVVRVVAALALGVSTFGLNTHAAEITDQRDKTFSFAKPPQRAVFLPIPGPATYIAIDQTDRNIVGMNPYAAIAMRDGFLGKLYPRFGQIKTNILTGAGDPSNFTPNVEGILALRPDVIFQWAAGTEAMSVLDQLGVPVVGMRASTAENVAEYMTIMGQIAGKESRVSALLQRQDIARQKMQTAMNGLADDQRPRVLYLNRSAQTLRVSGTNTFQNFYIGLTGGQNAAKGISTTGNVTIEQILTWNPQLILLGTFDNALPSDIYNDPRWQSIEGVRNRRVYRLPVGGYRWDPPSQESALTWTWLAGLLHPERAPADLRGSMREWFGFLYDHALTDDEIDAILQMPANRASAGYERYLVR